MSIIAGKYRARAIASSVQWGVSSNNNEQVAVTFEIVGGEFNGFHTTWVGNFSERGQEIALKALRACGWNGDDLTDLSGIEANEVELVLKEETYTGSDGVERTTVKVQWVNGGGKFEFRKPLDRGGLAAFAAKMKGAAVASRQPQASGDGSGRPRIAKPAEVGKTPGGNPMSEQMDNAQEATELPF